MHRWRGRLSAGLAALFLVGTAAGIMAARGEGTRFLVVRDAAGVELARAALPDAGELALRYRNSIYHSIAEERFRVVGDHLRLVGLSADELAVLEEYYTAVGAVHDASVSSLRWSVAVDRPPVELPLRVQATALGERVLLIGGSEIPLWRLVDGRDDTLVILSVEGAA